MFNVGDRVKVTGGRGELLPIGHVDTVLEVSIGGSVRIGLSNQFFNKGLFMLLEPASKAESIAGGLQEHSVGEFYPLAAVMYQHGEHTCITVENLQTGEVAGSRNSVTDFLTFVAAFDAIKKIAEGVYWSKVKGRVHYVRGFWVVSEPAKPVHVTRLRSMLHRG